MVSGGVHSELRGALGGSLAYICKLTYMADIEAISKPNSAPPMTATVVMM